MKLKQKKPINIYARHVLSTEGLQFDREKLKAMKEMPRAEHMNEVQCLPEKKNAELT